MVPNCCSGIVACVWFGCGSTLGVGFRSIPSIGGLDGVLAGGAAMIDVANSETS